MLESPYECRLRLQIDPILTRQNLLRRNFGLRQCRPHDVRGPPALRLLAYLGFKSLNELLDLFARTLSKHIHREALCFRFSDRCRTTGVV
jgi:hypothetical protein